MVRSKLTGKDCSRVDVRWAESFALLGWKFLPEGLLRWAVQLARPFSSGPCFFASSLADSAQNPRVQWAFAPPPPAGSSTTARATGAGAPASASRLRRHRLRQPRTHRRHGLHERRRTMLLPRGAKWFSMRRRRTTRYYAFSYASTPFSVRSRAGLKAEDERSNPWRLSLSRIRTI